MSILDRRYSFYPFGTKYDKTDICFAEHVNELQDSIHDICDFLRGTHPYNLWDSTAENIVGSNSNVIDSIESLCSYITSEHSSIVISSHLLEGIIVNLAETHLIPDDWGDIVSSASNTVGDKTTTELECAKITFSDDTYIETTGLSIHEMVLAVDEQGLIDLAGYEPNTANLQHIQILEKPKTVVKDSVNYHLKEDDAYIGWADGELLTTYWNIVLGTGTVDDGISDAGRDVLYLLSSRSAAEYNGAYKTNCGSLSVDNIGLRFKLKTNNFSNGAVGVDENTTLKLELVPTDSTLITVFIYEDSIYYRPNLGPFIYICPWTADVYHDLFFKLDGTAAAGGIGIKEVWVDKVLQASNLASSMRSSVGTGNSVWMRLRGKTAGNPDMPGSAHAYIDSIILGSVDNDTYAVPYIGSSFTMDALDNRYYYITNNNSTDKSIAVVFQNEGNL